MKLYNINIIKFPSMHFIWEFDTYVHGLFTTKFEIYLFSGINSEYE